MFTETLRLSESVPTRYNTTEVYLMIWIVKMMITRATLVVTEAMIAVDVWSVAQMHTP